MIEKNRLYAATGKLIHDLRIKKGVTQESLALAIGLSRTSVTNLEKGRQGVLLHTLYQIAETLDVSVSELLPKRALAPLGEQEALKMLLKDRQISQKDAAFVKKALQK